MVKIPKYCRICVHSNNNEECLFNEDYPEFIEKCEELELSPYHLADLLDKILKEVRGIK